MNERMLTTPEAAQVLGVSAERVRQLIKAGRLPSQQFGRDHVISEADLTLVSDRKPGRPKKPDEGEPIEPVQTPALISETKAAAQRATSSATAETKRAGKGVPAVETKPAKKRAAKAAKKRKV